MRLLDGQAVAVGAAVAIGICLPVALLAQVVADDGGEASAVAVVLFLAVLAGFAIGGYLAARRAPAAPFTNGAVAALAAFLVIQGTAYLVRQLGDDPVEITVMVFNALVAYACGLLGAFVAVRRPRSTEGMTEA